jgi:hypothetical protein
MEQMMTVQEIETACNLAEPPKSLRHPLELPELTLVKTFYPYGFPMQVRTNAAEVLEIEERLWGAFAPQHETKPIVSEVYVTEGEAPEFPQSPTYRFVRPLVTSIVDGGNYVLSDLERGRSYTMMTRGMLESPLYAEYFFMMAPLVTLPVKTIHAACVALDGRGVMLCGDSEAGKSTLSYACARAGWEYISDDRTHLLDCEKRIVAGDSHQVRLRASAADLFPDLPELAQALWTAGGPSIEFSTISMQHVKRRTSVQVDNIVFLNRKSGSPPALLPYRKDVARLYMNQSLFGTEEAARNHALCIDQMLAANVYELRYTDLNWAVDRLRKLLLERS